MCKDVEIEKKIRNFLEKVIATTTIKPSHQSHKKSKASCESFWWRRYINVIEKSLTAAQGISIWHLLEMPIFWTLLGIINLHSIEKNKTKLFLKSY